MADYNPTPDLNIINKVSVSNIDINLSEYINKYVTLKAEFLALPKPKTEPDQETLAVYNMELEVLNYIDLMNIKTRAKTLYIELKGVKDAGLLPSEFDLQFTQLENFVNS